jgi:hypothetical protein
MNFEPSTEIQCPYCGEVFTTFLDLSQGDTSYTEDCQVCCQPIQLEVHVGDLENEEFQVSVTAEN